HGQRVLEVGLDPLRVSEGGGTVTGRLTALSAGDSGLVALRDADLAAQDFDLEFARPFLDTLPFAGRLSGHTTATGPVSGLTLDIDWVFRDSLVPGHPATRIRGRGEVGLGGSGLRFQPVTGEAAAVEWGTVERLVQGDGVLRLGGDGASGRGVRDFTMRTRDLDLASWLKRAPASLLTVTVQGDVAVDSGAPPVGALRVRVEPSLFAGTPLDSGVAAV